ncbi:hypothetical protein OED01_13010 [Microbacterium sp. M28]|uniref:hypothetical protein n=1 Tax=Microbacterium sp. M28 TaxID=2962064 RepID=UPI0021F45F2A|nr:hypothetical protein [Microbacterium sp. M28]UYO96515.1 hypothetical protein OED01_13010 [Microbacterium sp. M28]
MKLRRVIAVAVAAGVLLGAGLSARAAELEGQREELLAQAGEVAAQADAAEDRTHYLSGTIALAEDQRDALQALADARPAFVDQLTALAAAFENAQGKVDVSDERVAAVSAQQTVLAERRAPETIAAATATIQALTTKVDQDVAAWDRGQVASSSATGASWAASGPDGYARVRAALDLVGGGGVGLFESSSCAGGTAPACANSDGFIKYRADVATWSEGRLNWAMAHELAHIHQFRVWGTLNDSRAYRDMFGGDPEFLANCMAVVRGYPGSVGCDPAQQAWASGIWVGAVR